MIIKVSKISQQGIMIHSSGWRAFVLCCALLMLLHNNLLSQVITNRSAVISVSPGAVIVSQDAENALAGVIANDGTINLTGNYISTSITSGNGLFRIGGNWVNSLGTLSGQGTVQFNGSINQVIQRTGGETFYNLGIDNSGAPLGRKVSIANNVTVTNLLYLNKGNIDAAAFRLILSNGAASALNYTSTTRSRILGKFERRINQAGTYLFPLGTTAFYNPARIKTNNIPTDGTVVSEFITAPPPGDAGFPFSDPPVEVFRTYPYAFWRFTADDFSSNNFNIDLTGYGFADTIFDVTRIVRRNNGGNWVSDGTHSDANVIDSVVFRNNLTGDISSTGTDFALARVRPLITDHPDNLIVCEKTNPVFSVTATGTAPLTYIWYKDGVAITSGPHYSGNRTNTLTILNAVLSDAGTYYCVVRDRDRNITASNTATLAVNKIPVATLTNNSQLHECSAVPFDNIVLGESYGVPFTTYFWTRTNTSAVITTVPLSGTGMNIGDDLEGSFTNITDSPVDIVFTITPVGPAPTYCTGIPVEAHLRINPTPRLIAENMKPQTCYNDLTEIKLTSPSVMTMGTVKFDYDITIAAPPAIVAGNRLPQTDVPLNTVLSFRYTNESNTIQPVIFNVTPKVVGLSCPAGVVGHPQVDVHAKPLQLFEITVPLTCEGASNASLKATPSLGASPYTYIWKRNDILQPGLTTAELINVRGGKWEVKVLDNLNCSNSAIQRVTGATFDTYLYVVDSTGFGTTCPGSNDGELWIMEKSVSTLEPFEYWVVRNSQDTVIHNTLPAKNVFQKYDHLLPGNYKLLIRDANGCYNNPPPEQNIIEPGVITPVFDVFAYPGGANVSCKNYNDGKVSVVSVTGGNGGYKFKWTTVDGLITGPDNLNRLDNIPAGTYYLTITDRKNCEKTFSVTLMDPEGMELQSSSVTNILCKGGSNGSIEMGITGGSGYYVYSWSGPGGFTASTKNISGLKAGTYSVQVTDQNNSSCIILPVPTFTLTEPPLLTASVITSHSNNTVDEISCYGGTGTINITPEGGTGGTYIYDWTTADGSGIQEGNEDQASVTAGTYEVVISDSNNCSITKNITITQPSALETQLLPKHITCRAGSFNDGSIELTVTGGAVPYTYLWSNGAVTKDVSGLTEGYYKVTVTDFNGCSLSDSVRINLPPPLTYTRILSDFRGVNISCNGQADGSIEVSMTGGTAPFVYTWSGPDGFSSASEDLAGLKAGQYNLTIVDSNACSATEMITLTEKEKLGIDISLSETGGGFNIGCAGGRTGTIDIEARNNTGSVEYLWDDGIFGKTRTGLPAGEYRLIITDQNNCYASSAINLTDPDSIDITFDISKPFCPDKPDGEIRLNVTGGVMGADYSYRWSDNSTARNLSGIDRGFYKVTVTDMNGCSEKDSVFVEALNETCLIIPNAISPNDDLINDVWNIGEKELYPSMEVKVFNRWGEAIWKSERGYPHPWDGRSKGSPLPIDSYHYIINLHNGSKPLIGNVTILK